MFAEKWEKIGVSSRENENNFLSYFFRFLMSFAFPHYAMRNYFKNKLHPRVRGFNTF